MQLSPRFSLCTPLLAIGLLATTPCAGGDCPTDGYCHLPSWTPAGLAPLDELGSAIALDDAHAAVAAPAGDAVYLYKRTGGVWVEDQTLDAPPTSGGGFGSSLAFFGGRLVIGDPSDSTQGAFAGAAHLYLRVGGVWAFAQTLTDPDGAAGDLLGTAVTVTDTWVVAGAPGDEEGGRVHLFLESEAWAWRTSISDFSTGTVPEAFGSAVAMRDQWLLIGDPLSDTDAVDTGVVMLFEVYDVFSFYQDKIDLPNVLAGDGFGGALDFEGDRVVVGARGDDELGIDAGAAYVFSFEYPASTSHELNLVQRVLACGGGPGHGFGTTVGIDGDRLVVGAPGKDPMGAPGGRVLVFAREPGVAPETWSARTELAPSNGLIADRFGASAAVSGDHVLVGSPGADTTGAESGAAHLVSLTPLLLPGGECPCDTLASVTSFGTGKTGTAGIPQLALDRPPVPGEPSMIQLSESLPGATPLLLWGLTPTALPFDGGELYIADLHVEVMPVIDPTGAATLLWDVAPMPGLCGTEIIFQAMFADPGAASAFHTAQSGGIAARVGY